MSNIRREERDALRTALSSKNRHERAEAALRLGEAGDRDALGKIEKLSHARDHLTAVSALYAAWRIGAGVRGVERMVRALASRDEETMQLAVMALCEMGDAVVDELAATLEGPSPHKIKVVRVLGDIKGRRALRALRTAAESSDAAVRREARSTLES